jgi:hypothetical protein
MSGPEAAVEDIRDTQEGPTRHRRRPALREYLSRAIIQAARAIRKHYPIPSRIEARRRQNCRPCFVPPESRSPEMSRRHPRAAARSEMKDAAHILAVHAAQLTAIASSLKSRWSAAMTRSVKPGVSKERGSKVVAQAMRPWLSACSTFVPRLIWSGIEGLIADLAAVADAEASPVHLLQCRDMRWCAAMHVRMGVNAFKRRLSRPGTNGRDAKRGKQISPSNLVYSGLTSSIRCLEKLMSSFAAGPCTSPRSLPFS